MIILGLDVSLNKTGAAVIDTITRTFQTFTFVVPAKTVKAGGHERIQWVRDSLHGTWNTFRPDVAVVEAPAYGAQGSAVYQLAGIRSHLTHDLWTWGTPYASISPGTCKVYATGNGNADKDAMILATARAFADFAGDNNAADALWLAAMGSDHYGQPIVEVAGKKRRDSIQGTKKTPHRWPELRGAGA
jgi:Holliday junction resolvasome RuvABC endonuclease subunit